MRPSRVSACVLSVALALAAGACGTAQSPGQTEIVINSLEDIAAPPAGTVTLRSAIAAAGLNSTITFDSALDGTTILLTVVGDAHSILLGEIYSGMTFAGYGERDYGKSALYARKDLTIDASRLPNGITVKWDGGGASRARVLAVYGDLTMRNVTVSSGYSQAEAITGGTQPYTLARGGGLAVWGVLTLEDCEVIGNTCFGDYTASRDRGTYGGGIYANELDLRDSIISGNAALGYGAAGGGIYSVGGAERTSGRGADASLARCTISGNRVMAQHAYGGGIFTLAGGPTNLATMYLTNCTIARNLVEDNPDLPEAGQYYYRGGGIYMGGGSVEMLACTIAENAVTGFPAVFSNKPNMGGGGGCATIGNAHTVENVFMQNTIAVGNTLNGAAEDWFAGSILHFYSRGYNLVGVVNSSQILVPVPAWMMSSRKHWPKAGDADGVGLTDALDVAGAIYHDTALSVGVAPGQPVVLWYPPTDLAADKIPNQQYAVSYVNVGYAGYGGPDDDFLNHVILQLRSEYGSILGADFGEEFGDLTGVTWYGPATTWPSNAQNAAWIAFWRNLDIAIGSQLGMVILGDDFWGTFTSGPLGSHVVLTVQTTTTTHRMEPSDQRRNSRPRGTLGDIGAIER
ncbi:MAG: hypothetical protein A2W20_07615 [Candidatus Aminicenantes bacterium RBG_16_66_30]|nr:MAG: hypothetical protein A2W20_07615 [Candidatus Aminicenantes bacterium RBG_16_66_30]